MARKQNRLTIYTLGLGFLLPLGLLSLYVFVKNQPTNSSPDQVASTLPAVKKTAAEKTTEKSLSKEITAETLFPETESIHIKDVLVNASVAKTWPERIMGLSDTPFLPEDVVKFFAFESDGYHSIWMKDMNYAIDIIWTDVDGSIVSLVENATPESYPDTFTPDVLARFVVETTAGFVKKNHIVLGDKVDIPNIEYQ